MICAHDKIYLTAKGLLDRDGATRRNFPVGTLLARVIASRIFDATSDGSNWISLHYSAYSGMAETCADLLIKGADVNKINTYGDTPLHLACLKANYACIEEILAWKPNVNIRNCGMHTPLNLFINNPPQNEDILKKILDAGSDPDISDKDGYTALHVLALQVETEKTEVFARLLLKYNANVNSLSYFQKTPLHIAINGGARNLVRVLLEYGASFDNPDVCGNTPLDLALEKRSRDPRVFDPLAKHLIRQSCCGLPVNSRHLDNAYCTLAYQYYRIRCEEEIQRLKNTRVGESTVTFFDILLSPVRRLAKYLRNQNILVTLEEFDKEKYIFGPALVRNFHEGLKHYHGINLGISAAQTLFPSLPEYCIEELIKYLDIDNCSNFHKACNF